MKTFKDFIEDQNWLLLVCPLVPLIWICWPIGSWHLWSWLFIGVLIWVLIDELLGKFSPEHKTISNIMRDYRRQSAGHTVRFWIAMTLYMLFSFFLVIHLATF